MEKVRMIINKSRINSIDKYLGNVNEDKKIYISVLADNKSINILKQRCGVQQYEIGRKFVPKRCGPITKFNRDGKEFPYKDRKKEERIFERDYHVVDWHGEDHYGTCFQTRKCYPKGIIEPPLEGIILDNGRIRSELVSIVEKKRLRHIINMFLEIFNYCEILDENDKSINKNIKIKTISWKILPPGKYPWDKAKNELKHYFENTAEKNKRVLLNRHKTISEYNPDFMAIGQDSFAGYVVYGYSSDDIYIFESDQINNATYVFKGKWEDASKLSKRDIIQGKLCYQRLIHSKEWEKKIDKLF